MTKSPIKWWRLSLRELLGIFAFVAVSFASLLNASQGWAMAVFGLTIVLAVVLAIVAATERGARQAAAIGAVITMVVYAVLWTQQPATTMDNEPDIDFATGKAVGIKTVLQQAGYLPTSHVLNTMWKKASGTYLVEMETGRVVEKLSSNYPRFEGGGIANSQIPPNWNGGTLISKGLPAPEHFLAIGHCLWAILFAYLGGKFAVWVYLRRMSREGNSIEIAQS
ncbi:hypothetical protein [Aeoliella sp.]|uniref:hypothetical protein n=1 Tax=Aeoliella sp. TaxID=2795800 RepID=UPI003CCB7E69